MKSTVDMSQGKPWKLIFIFALPMLLSVTFQQLYNIADSVIAGQMIGKHALAAVTASFPITMIFISVAMGLSAGFSVVCGRIYGEKNYDKLKSAVSSAFVLSLIVAIVLTIAGFFCAEPILRLLGTPNEVLVDSVDYLQYCVIGIVFTFIYNSCTATFQALGNSKIPLFFLIFSTVFNVVLDIIFVGAFGWGVWALSLATVIAQGVACVLSTLVLVNLLHGVDKEHQSTEPRENIAKRFIGATKTVFVSLTDYILGRKSYKRVTWGVIKEIMTIGVPSIIQRSTVAIGQLFIQSLVNSFGPDVLAGYGAGQKIQIFCINLIVTFGGALSVFVSQNIGAGRRDRIKEGTISAGLMTVIMTTVIIAVVMLFPSPLVSLFVEGEGTATVINTGVQMLSIITPFYMLLAFKSTLDNVFMGASRAFGVTLGTALDLIVRVVIAFVLVDITGVSAGIWWSWPIGWAVGLAGVVIVYFIDRKLILGLNDKSEKIAKATENGNE
ncbi:MAG: MATE family efflux transporter [Clostridia bacterium]|nr:MATE family efflux transporter [Clostridia bacterium]